MAQASLHSKSRLRHNLLVGVGALEIQVVESGPVVPVA
jgi:hypothetical protein